MLVVVDPVGLAAIFMGITEGFSTKERRSVGLRACLIAAAILVGFALFGEDLLGALHIALDSFRIAGGIMLFLIALEMVFEKRTERREGRAEKIRSHPPVEDVSVFPMAMPMLAGPGSIASIMLLSARAQGTSGTLIVLAALAAVMLLSFLALLAAGPMIRLLGDRVEAVLTRLLGLLLAALAAQFVIDGVRAGFAG